MGKNGVMGAKRRFGANESMGKNAIMAMQRRCEVKTDEMHLHPKVHQKWGSRNETHFHSKGPKIEMGVNN